MGSTTTTMTTTKRHSSLPLSPPSLLSANVYVCVCVWWWWCQKCKCELILSLILIFTHSARLWLYCIVKYTICFLIRSNHEKYSIQSQEDFYMILKLLHLYGYFSIWIEFEGDWWCIVYTHTRIRAMCCLVDSWRRVEKLNYWTIDTHTHTYSSREIDESGLAIEGK